VKGGWSWYLSLYLYLITLKAKGRSIFQYPSVVCVYLSIDEVLTVIICSCPDAIPIPEPCWTDQPLPPASLFGHSVKLDSIGYFTLMSTPSTV
jgi:hypothetical protein